MTINHHPSDETLLRFAAGTLPAGPRLIVAVHAGGCPTCRQQVAAFEAIGGAMLDAGEPAGMASDALQQALARIDQEPGRAEAAAPTISLPRADLGIALPQAMDACGIGPWRWLGPGLRWSRVTVPDAPEANVMLLRVAAGKTLPEHTHSGSEFTQVLKGSFCDARGRYLPGDMDEADAEVDHTPVVDADGECICVAAIDGQMKLTGFVGRVVQRFVSF